MKSYKLSQQLSRSQKDDGFTLVELLVVVVIIATLVGLSLAGYTKFRGAADKATALGNLRQLQIANANYATDHNGSYVSSFAKDEDGKLTEKWDTNIEFLNNLRGASTISASGWEARDVPTGLLDPKAYRGNGTFHDKLKGSYGAPEVFGVAYGAQGSDSHFKLVQLTAPERTAAFVTAIDWHVVYGGRLTWDGTEGPPGRGIMAYRHNDKALVVYYDGHVGEVTKEDIKRYDGQGGKEHPFWNGAY